jgi:hypothetical protein
MAARLSMTKTHYSVRYKVTSRINRRFRVDMSCVRTDLRASMRTWHSRICEDVALTHLRRPAHFHLLAPLAHSLPRSLAPSLPPSVVSVRMGCVRADQVPSTPCPLIGSLAPTSLVSKWTRAHPRGLGSLCPLPPLRARSLAPSLASAKTQARPRGRVAASAWTWYRHVDASTWTWLPPPPTPSLTRSLAPFRLCGRSADARKKIKIKIYFYFYLFLGSCCLLEKREKKCSVFGFQSPRSLRSPSSAGFAGEAARRRRFFRPSSPSHPSKLYSSLRWLNSKVRKPFFPFILRLINVDGF